MPTMNDRRAPRSRLVYRIEAKADDRAEILIYDEIGADPWTGTGIGADDFVRELQAIKAPRIDVRINSGGGSVFEGNAIYNALPSKTEPPPETPGPRRRIHRWDRGVDRVGDRDGRRSDPHCGQRLRHDPQPAGHGLG